MFETFTPRLPGTWQKSAFVAFLANIAPALQHHVLDQMRRPKFVVADTMDLWLNIALPDLLKLLKRVDGFVLNESEASPVDRRTQPRPRGEKDPSSRAQNCYCQKRRARRHHFSVNGKLFVAPAFPLSTSWTRPARGDCFDGRHDGVSFHGPRFCRKQPSPRAILHGKCIGIILLRRLWPEIVDAGDQGINRQASQTARKTNAVLTGSPRKAIFDFAKNFRNYG